MEWSHILLSGLVGGYLFSRLGLLLTERRRGRRLPQVHAAAWALTLATHLGVAYTQPGVAVTLSAAELALTAGLLALVQAGWWIGDIGRERKPPGGPAAGG